MAAEAIGRRSDDEIIEPLGLNPFQQNRARWWLHGVRAALIDLALHYLHGNLGFLLDAEDVARLVGHLLEGRPATPRVRQVVLALLSNITDALLAALVEDRAQVFGAGGLRQRLEELIPDAAERR